MANDKVIVGGGYVDKNGEYRRLPDRELELAFEHFIEMFGAPKPGVLICGQTVRELLRGKSSR